MDKKCGAKKASKMEQNVQKMVALTRCNGTLILQVAEHEGHSTEPSQT